MNPIASRKNPRIVEAARLERAAVRHSQGLTLIEGPHILQEAIAGGVRVVEVFGLETDEVGLALAKSVDAAWWSCTQEVLERLASTENPRGPVAVIEIPIWDSPEGDLLVIDVSDPGNAGTLIRTAAAFGFEVGLPPGSVDAWSPKVIRAGAGAHFRTRVFQPLKSTPAGYGTVATVVAGGVSPDQVRLDPERRWAILIGSEAHGLDADIAARADIRVTIAMPGGTESLNAAVAGSIIAYELAKSRNIDGSQEVGR